MSTYDDVSEEFFPTPLSSSAPSVLEQRAKVYVDEVRHYRTVPELRALELDLRKREIELAERKFEYRLSRGQKSKSLPIDIGRKSRAKAQPVVCFQTLKPGAFAKLHQILDPALITQANDRDLEKLYEAITTNQNLLENKETVNAMLKALIRRRKKKNR